MFALQNAPAAAALELPGLSLRAGRRSPRRHAPSSTSRSALAGDAATALGRLPGVQHRPVRRRDRSSGWSATRTLLAAAAADPGAPARRAAAARRRRSARQLAGRVERHGRAPMPGGDAAARAVRGAGGAHARTPSAVACEGEQLTYGELDRARQPPGPPPARAGRRAGGAGGRSASSARRRWWWRCSAILKAGGAYVPLDPGLSRASGWRCMLEDSGVPCCSPQEALLRRAAAARGRGPCAWTGRGGASRRRARRTRRRGAVRGEPGLRALHLGLDGPAKGVRCRTARWSTSCAPWRERPGLAADDVLLAVTTLSFDIAGLELYLPLAVGARVVLASREEAAGRRAAGAALARARRHRDAGDARHLAAAARRRLAGRAGAQGALRRRGPAARPGRGAARPRRRAVERLPRPGCCGSAGGP